MAIALARHIECLGGVEKYDCFLFHPSDVNCIQVFEPLRNAFRTVNTFPYEPRLKGWPDGPNQCFYETCSVMARQDDPWLWLEADCVPTKPQWMDNIHREYVWNNMPIMGVLNDTFDLEGKITGQHVTGVAVYPNDLMKTCPLLRSMVRATEQYRQSGSLPPAFDCYIAPYAVKNCAETTIIRHYWKSENYRESPLGDVHCDFQIPYGKTNEVDMDASLIHGCKDFSLLNILQCRLIGGLTATIPVIMKENA